ncbi:MAG: preprotein translocase subunit SecG [Rhodospirillaceae bacterium]|jgi:preprotein translocase subunit SecG|nr:preprotein translocase subunit SecG [Rhodospirillaceae bacterium]MBT5567222.1 preprotein translocase subunit SecG [Rhodospirillaceae bacterium]MBT6089435.1 preprotein translocase subunit SecG [Rhodospirillaceae bacterium]MBT7451613.1 preprotein translocase subunit SecG [Rhodospirillaceae bacterium]
METVLLVIHLLIAIVMISMILLQKSEGGAMGGGLTGGASVTGMSQSQARATPITRTTTILGMCFFASSLGLALLAKPQDAPIDIFATTPIEEGAGEIPIVPVVPTVPSVPVDE